MSDDINRHPAEDMLEEAGFIKRWVVCWVPLHPRNSTLRLEKELFSSYEEAEEHAAEQIDGYPKLKFSIYVIWMMQDDRGTYPY